jgi:hypothetical protein
MQILNAVENFQADEVEMSTYLSYAGPRIERLGIQVNKGIVSKFVTANQTKQMMNACLTSVERDRR